MNTVNVSDFKARLLALVEEIASSGQPLMVTKHGKPIVQVIPATDKCQRPVAGSLRHTLIHMDDDIVSPILEWACMEEPATYSRNPPNPTRASKRKPKRKP